MAGPRHGWLGRAAPLVATAAAILSPLGACSDDDEPAASTTSRPVASTTTDTDTTGAELEPVLVEASDLPSGFEPADGVDDTITTFCAAEDAAAGLSAESRAVAGFNREAPGSSVVQLVFAFEDDDAATFVAQADAILERCSEVPDFTGLAFDYEPASDALVSIFTPTDGHTTAYGTSVGSGNFTVAIAVFHRGEVGELIAVLGIDLPRAELDEVARAAFSAAVERLMQ